MTADLSSTSVKSDIKGLRLGFIGVGTINEAIVTGLCSRVEDVGSISLSPRSADKVERIVRNFGGRIDVEKDNQAVVDMSDIVFLGVLPKQAQAVLQDISFSDRCGGICSLVAGVSREEVADWARLPVSKVVRAVPLPAVAKRNGVTVVHVASTGKYVEGQIKSSDTISDRVVAVFSKLGTVVAASSAAQVSKLQTLTSMMGPYYGAVRAAAEWLITSDQHQAEKINVTKAEPIDSYLAASFSASLFSSIAADAAAAAAEAESSAIGTQSLEHPHLDASDIRGGLATFDHLIAEQTEGGYNEQALRLLSAERCGEDQWEAGVFGAMKRTLTAVNDRWEGRAPVRSRSTATTGDEDLVFLGKHGLRSYGERKARLHAALAELGIDAEAYFEGEYHIDRAQASHLDDDEENNAKSRSTIKQQLRSNRGSGIHRSKVALRLYRSFLLPKSPGALAVASTANRAGVVAAQIAFALRESDAERAAWLCNVDASATEAVRKRQRLFRGRGWERQPHILDSEESGTSTNQGTSTSREDARCTPGTRDGMRNTHASEPEVSSSILEVVLVLDGLRSGENVGSLIRSSEAAGCVIEVVTCGTCPGPDSISRSKAVLKAAVNSDRFVPCRREPSVVNAVIALKEKGFVVWALETTENARVLFDATENWLKEDKANSNRSEKEKRRLALVLGNELVGVDTRVIEECDQAVVIPTFGVKNSLNVAAAGAVALFEIVRAWGAVR